MSRFSPTPEQQSAITAPPGSVLVSAAAGSGKTSVLTERCFARLLDTDNPTTPGKLLVVTFTEAAAAEMHKRLFERVESEIAACNDIDSIHMLKRLRLEMDRAQISTLHAFCLRLLTEHFEIAGLDPDFSVMDEVDASLLLRDTAEELLEHLFQQGSSDFTALVDAYGDTLVEKTIGKLRQLWSSLPDPDAWRNEALHLHEQASYASMEHPWMQWQQESVISEIKSLRREGTFLRDSIPQVAKLIDSIMDAFTSLATILKTGGWDAFVDEVRKCGKVRLVTPRNFDASLKARVKNWHDRYKKCIDAMSKGDKGHPLVKTTEMARDAVALLPHVKTLFACALQLEQRYREAKDRLRRLDYNDLERFAYNILIEEDNGLSGQVRQSFDDVLVDEYQDINPLQNAILECVCRRKEDGDTPNLFAVGDIKQSIYGFRLAEPKLFLDKMQKYSTSEEEGRRIDLTRNFRSRAEVLNCVNAIFSVWMCADSGGPEYDERARLFPGMSYPDPPAAIKTFSGLPAVLHLAESNPYDEEVRPTSDKERMAARLAQKVKSLLDDGYHVLGDDGEYRPLEPKDIVVLLRSKAGRASCYLEALQREGIPAEGPESAAGGAPFETFDLKNLLAIIDNPQQDIPLATVLRSPLAQISDESLLRLRHATKKENLWTIIQRTDSLDDKTEREKLVNFLQRLEHWRTLPQRLTMSQLLEELLRDTGYLEYVCGTPNGQKRHDNILAMIESARRFDNTSRRGLHRFLEFIDREKKESHQEDAGQDDGQSQGTVRIMTIHKSKGLEFPVVLVADCGKAFNFMDLWQRINMGAIGMGMVYSDPREGFYHDTLGKMYAVEAARNDLLAEELRLMYVAATRAKEHLIFCAGVKKLEEKLDKQPCSPEECRANWSRSTSMLDWLLPLIGEYREGAWLAMNNTMSVQCQPEPYMPGSAFAGAKADKHDQQWWVDKLAQAERADIEYLDIHTISPLSTMAAKMSVSELKRRASHQQDSEESLYIFPDATLSREPRFISGQAMSPTRLGTAVHAVMQHWNRSAGSDSAISEIERICEAGFITSEEANSINPDDIAAFLKSDLGEMFLDKAWTLQRELPFSLAIPAAEVEPSAAASEEFILVQGIIDALLTKNEQAIIIDFKTDRVEKQAVEKRAEYYRTQLQYYTRAVKEGLGFKQIESHLAFLNASVNQKM
jgi:ATP-dependent helicase/nuclease subunit A